jgi:hypothetical protein
MYRMYSQNPQLKSIHRTLNTLTLEIQEQLQSYSGEIKP